MEKRSRKTLALALRERRDRHDGRRPTLSERAMLAEQYEREQANITAGLYEGGPREDA